MEKLFVWNSRDILMADEAASTLSAFVSGPVVVLEPLGKSSARIRAVNVKPDGSLKSITTVETSRKELSNAINETVAELLTET